MKNAAFIVDNLFAKGKSLNTALLYFLLVIVIVVNGYGLCFPMLGSNDGYFYGVVAKHIVLNHDWINLTFNGKDWLDKPHLPFWLTAISYEIFGVNAFAYILPGFIFNLLGAYFIYRLARQLYNHKVGILAALIYLSSIHLLLSSIDVRAEAFLLGEIIPACYYWRLYDLNDKIKFRYLLPGAIFTAMALMTKGPFTVVPIFSGIMVLWLIKKQYAKFYSVKWLLALFLSLVLILPELFCLYQQFDRYPEKIIFGQTHVSGIKWFFYGSQLGRFFNNGAITGNNHGVAGYLFFVHTFLWAFLPWSIVFIAALIKIGSRDERKLRRERLNSIYLLASFLPTFILFSLSKFQLDHYTNILIPFAAIIVAAWFYHVGMHYKKHVVFYLQDTIAIILLALVSVLVLFMFNGLLFLFNLTICLIAWLGVILFSKNSALNKAIIYPIIAVSLLFVVVMSINGRLYLRDNAGFNIAAYLASKPDYPVVDYQQDLNSLEFYSHNPYDRISALQPILVMTADNFLQQSLGVKNQYNLIFDHKDFYWYKEQKLQQLSFNAESVVEVAKLIDNVTANKEVKTTDLAKLFNVDLEATDINKLQSLTEPYYLVVSDTNWQRIKANFASAIIEKQFTLIPQEKFIPTLFSLKNRQSAKENILLILIPKNPVKIINANEKQNLHGKDRLEGI